MHSKLLEEEGFVWAQKRGEFVWHKQFQNLLLFKRQNGHCLVPTKFRGLGRWVSEQRSMFKKFRSSDGSNSYRIHHDVVKKRIEELNRIEFIWDATVSRQELAE